MKERSAFPEEITKFNGGTGKYEHVGECAGMTLREWYAGMALAGLLSESRVGIPNTWVAMAEHSFKIADEMMKSAEARRAS